MCRAGDEAHGIVRGGVVDVDQFERWIRLLAEAVEAAAQKRRAVPGGDDRGDEPGQCAPHRVHAFFSTPLYARMARFRPTSGCATPMAAATMRIAIPPRISHRSASAFPGENHFRA